MPDPISGFIDKLAGYGIRLSHPDQVIADGAIHRLHVAGDKRTAKNLCYLIHADQYPSAWFQDHKRGLTESFSLANGAANNLTPEERAILRERWDAQRLEREAAQAQQYAMRAAFCRDLLGGADLPPDEHPYAVRKGIIYDASVRRISSVPRTDFFNDPEATGELRDCLLIPLLDAENSVCSVQAILPDGEKFYAAGASTRAAWHPIKGTRYEPILICEGWATGAALHAATGCSVVCAMTANNLEAIAGFCLKRFPGRRPLVMGDNDHRTEGNPGATKAHAAAEAHGLTCLLPTFAAEAAGTDWDDWLREGGAVNELMASVEQAMASPVLAPAAEVSRETLNDQSKNSADIVDIKTKTKRGKGKTTPQGLPPDGELVDGNTGSVFVSWQSLGLQTSHRGEPHATIDNVQRILMHHPELNGRLWYDEFHERTFQTIFQSAPTEWADHHDTDMTVFIQSQLRLHKVGVNIVQRAVDSFARHHSRNEPRDWMESLRWDQTERLPLLLPDGFGALQNEYTAAVGRCFMVGIVARIYSPGCKVDSMPVFEGGQGLGKSTALRVLGGKWFAEATQSPTDKDFYLNLTGKMLVEIGEMDAFSRAEINKVKQVMSCETDRYRAPYERRATDHPRRSAFAGTTNRDDWNKDETGARRFWPVACTEVNLSFLATNRDQLFAEAVHRFKAGEPWWDVPADLATAEQDLRRADDEWIEAIRLYINEEPTPREHGGVFWTRRLIPLTELTVSGILEFALQKAKGNWTRSDEMRISACLKRMKFKRKRRNDRWVYLLDG